MASIGTSTRDALYMIKDAAYLCVVDDLIQGLNPNARCVGKDEWDEFKKVLLRVNTHTNNVIFEGELPLNVDECISVFDIRIPYLGTFNDALWA